VHLTRVVVIGWSVLLSAGCGSGDGGGTAEDAVKRWAEAVNNRDWARACNLSVEPGARCEQTYRSDFDGDTLTFEGPASNGAGTKPGEAYFALHQAKGGGTIFVTAVPGDGGFVVRLEAVVIS